MYRPLHRGILGRPGWMGKEHLREQRPCTLWGAKPLLAILPLLYHCQELVTNTYGISYLTDYNTVIYSSQISPGSAFLPHYTCFYFAPKKKEIFSKLIFTVCVFLTGTVWSRLRGFGVPRGECAKAGLWTSSYWLFSVIFYHCLLVLASSYNVVELKPTPNPH